MRPSFVHRVLHLVDDAVFSAPFARASQRPPPHRGEDVLVLHVPDALSAQLRRGVLPDARVHGFAPLMYLPIQASRAPSVLPTGAAGA